MSQKPIEFAAMLVAAAGREVSEELFSVEGAGLLAVRLSERGVRVRPSRIIAGHGRVNFTPSAKLVTQEGGDGSAGGLLAGYAGEGGLFVGDEEKRVSVIRMRTDESFGIAAHALLAADERAVIDELPSAAAFGGAWHALMVTGPAHIALATRGVMRPLPVSEAAPVFAKPGFVVGWTIGLGIELKGAKPAEARLSFTGTGVVYVAESADENWRRA